MLKNLCKPVAIITGTTGQDGILLSKILVEEGYDVIGLTRSLAVALAKSKKINVLRSVNIVETTYSKKSLLELINLFRPQLIFNLAGQSYVSKSWELIEETVWSQGVITGNLLEAIRLSGQKKIKLINATSSEIFDFREDPPYSEKSRLHPYNPYGCSQILSSQLIEIFRERFGIFACNAILFPHESIYRQDDFFFMRVIKSAKKIADGEISYLDVGNMATIRDWGCAREYMDGIFRMTKLSDPQDICFSTGYPLSVEDVVRISFEFHGLDYKSYVRQSEELKRYYEPKRVYGSFSKALNYLGWTPTLKGDGLVKKLSLEVSLLT